MEHRDVKKNETIEFSSDIIVPFRSNSFSDFEADCMRFSLKKNEINNIEDKSSQFYYLTNEFSYFSQT